MQITPRDKRILQVTGIALPLLLLVYFFVLRPNGGEDVALLSGPTGITGSTGVPAESPSVTPSPTPRETLPPVSLAGSRDPFSIPPGLELSTAAASAPPRRGGTTTIPATTRPAWHDHVDAPATTPPPPPTTTTTPPPGAGRRLGRGGGGGGENPGNKT